MEVFKTGNVSVRWHGHSSISLAMPSTRIYVDPYHLHGRWPAASYVLVTHPHYDHLDPTTIEKLDDGETTFVIPDSLCCHDLPVPSSRTVRLTAGDQHELPDRPVTIHAKPAYNPEKRFHPESEQWLGYVIETPRSRIYHAGDTGPIDVSFSDSLDLSLVPVDGIYTMDARTAASWADSLPTAKASPIHYGTIRGSRSDAVNFRRSLSRAQGLNLEESRLAV